MLKKLSFVLCVLAGVIFLFYALSVGYFVSAGYGFASFELPFCYARWFWCGFVGHF